MKRIVVLIDSRQIGTEGSAVDTVGAALDSTGIVARVLDDGVASDPGAPLMPTLAAAQKEVLVDALISAVFESENFLDHVTEALRHGRTGFDRMSEEELYASADLWGIEPRRFGFARWPGSSLPPSWKPSAPTAQVSLSSEQRRRIMQAVVAEVFRSGELRDSMLRDGLLNGLTGLRQMSDWALRNAADQWQIDVAALLAAADVSPLPV